MIPEYHISYEAIAKQIFFKVQDTGTLMKLNQLKQEFSWSCCYNYVFDTKIGSPTFSNLDSLHKENIN